MFRIIFIFWFTGHDLSVYPKTTLELNINQSVGSKEERTALMFNSLGIFILYFCGQNTALTILCNSKCLYQQHRIQWASMFLMDVLKYRIYVTLHEEEPLILFYDSVMKSNIQYDLFQSFVEDAGLFCFFSLLVSLVANRIFTPVESSWAGKTKLTKREGATLHGTSRKSHGSLAVHEELLVSWSALDN